MRRETPRIGPLLRGILTDEVAGRPISKRDSVMEVDMLYRVEAAGHIGASPWGALPLVAKVPTIAPKPGEGWESYKDRAMHQLHALDELLQFRHGLKPTPLVAANAFQATAVSEQVHQLSLDDESGIDLIELDPLLQVVQMDDVVQDVGLPRFRSVHPTLDGSGVRVAVLDSGVDIEHPYLEVADSVATSDEEVLIPGEHGTHCAGSIASSDDVFPGIAPGVTLLNVKVLSSAGQGRHTMVALGVDAALDRGAHVLSMSLGFNHLPTWSDGGHGWTCASGDCPLCTAVNNATVADNALVVVAGGNEHLRAEHLRSLGHATSFDTELGCPGQSRSALTVGAIEKRTHAPASFSSRGPSSYGLEKPDLCAPGVNITSTIPVRRQPDGTVDPPPRDALFGRKSGTSMATPIAAGAVALLVQEKIDNGKAWTPLSIRAELLEQYTSALGDPSATGIGRLVLNHE